MLAGINQPFVIRFGASEDEAVNLDQGLMRNAIDAGYFDSRFAVRDTLDSAIMRLALSSGRATFRESNQILNRLITENRDRLDLVRDDFFSGRRVPGITTANVMAVFFAHSFQSSKHETLRYAARFLLDGGESVMRGETEWREGTTVLKMLRDYLVSPAGKIGPSGSGKTRVYEITSILVHDFLGGGDRKKMPRNSVIAKLAKDARCRIFLPSWYKTHLEERRIQGDQKLAVALGRVVLRISGEVDLSPRDLAEAVHRVGYPSRSQRPVTTIKAQIARAVRRMPELTLEVGYGSVKAQMDDRGRIIGYQVTPVGGAIDYPAR